MGTDSLTVAKRRALRVAAQIEQEFEIVPLKVGLIVDPVVLEPFVEQAEVVSAPVVVEAEATTGITLGDLYDAYMRIVLSILGRDTPVRSITRSQCREMIEVLRWQPRNASKLFPKLSPVEIAERSKAEGRADLINPANINTYLNKLGGLLNWAVKEEVLDRNPAQGLRVPDPTARRDKRLPLSTSQLQAIFSTPLYTGCRDDGHGYATPGSERPTNARFWIPLLSMFGGLRLNEACQLDAADIRRIDEVDCFVITERSDHDGTDKRLKTSASEQIVLIHATLAELGFLKFVDEQMISTG